MMTITCDLCNRRLASSRARNTGNSPVEIAQPQACEELDSPCTRPGVYTEVSSPAAGSTNARTPSNNGVTQPSAPPPRSSLHDVTLVDNDLYQWPLTVRDEQSLFNLTSKEFLYFCHIIVGNAEIWLVIIETSDQHYKRILYCVVCTRCCAIFSVQYCAVQYCEILHCAVLSFLFAL